MLLYGHRGARGEAPENTLAGFRHLRDLDIHRVELDLRLSKDQQLMVLHDKTLERTIQKAVGPVSDFTAAELEKLEAKQTLTQFKEGLEVPTLHNVLAEWSDLKSIQLEVKPASPTDLPIIAKQLQKLISEFSLEHKAIITSSHTGFLTESRRVNKGIDHGLVADRFVYNPVSVAHRLKCSYLIANWRIVNEALVNKAISKDLLISSWTVNRLPKAVELKELRIHSLITDVPKQLRGVCDFD